MEEDPVDTWEMKRNIRPLSHKDMDGDVNDIVFFS